MKKGMGNHSGSHAHEESSDSQRGLCERVKTNAHKYINFYHKYCRDKGGGYAEEQKQEEEEESSSWENSLLKGPTLRERRKFKVIQGGGEKKGFNFGSAQMRSLNDRRSYTSLYFPSVIETDSEGGSISDGSSGGGISEGSNGGGSSSDRCSSGGASPCKQKENPPSQENTHNQLYPRRGAYARVKFEGGEKVSTCLNGKEDNGFSAGHLLNDVDRREEGSNTSLLLEGKYLQKGAQKKKKQKKKQEKKQEKKRKRQHCVYLSGDGMKYSHSNHGEGKAVSSNGVNSLKAHVRRSLSNFKKQKEVLTFINDTYKTILMMCILSLLLTKGILMCTFLYFLQSVCHFALFHLYVREYAARKRCGPA
ncbi:hypothetical protein PCYB_032540 [Plasmodium cynomolgi strain B]|uniref:Uncharacterized protein n=1 Tax=Plasmodium cynomolgi (strain B) TaxID=1120755 RepID=K6UIA3_PLACD|nr:hypothetical protein PCYB_032540 [Plasmodium cynomolgi strain B]GAB64843.1 hypothetical protein PCYB_032540 [Plasmodium cynomolgi strain B]